MNHSMQKSGLIFLVVIAVLACFFQAVTAQRYRPGRPGSGASLKVGQKAPDVELAVLEFHKDKKGQVTGAIGPKPVKLSTYKGKAPICIFSSSYT